MAIRVLSRPPLHLHLIDFTLTRPHPPSKIRSFCTPSSSPPQIPSQAPSNSQFNHRASLASLLHRYGFPSSQLPQFIQKNPFLLTSSSSNVESCIRILLSFGLSQNSLVSLLSSYPSVLDLGVLEKWQLCFSELDSSTFSPHFILEQCGRLRIRPDELRLNVLVMKELGFGGGTVSQVLKALPTAFVREPIDVERRVKFLKAAIGVENCEIDRICYQYPEFLAFGIETRLRPLFEEIADLGFGRWEVKKALLDRPRLLLGMEAGELTRCLELVKSLHCRAPIKERILANGPLSAAINVKLRVDCLCSHGLIHRDSFKVLFVEPRTVLYSLEDIEKKIGFLLQKIGFSIESLVGFPEFLGVNLEKQIMPRHDVVQHLRSKGALGFEVGLKHLVKLSRLRFYNLFVKPYPECEKFFGQLVRKVEVKPRHPAGLWKLLQPQKFPDTAEDIKNMKLFMKSLV